MSESSASAFRLSQPMQPGSFAPISGMSSAGKQGRPGAFEFFSFDEKYVRHLIDCDPETECHFVEYFSLLLRAKLQLRLRSAQDVDDLRQEVFLRVLQSLRNGPGLQHPGKLGAFVNAVCNNVIMEHIRSKSRTSQWDENVQEPRGALGDFENDIMSEEIHEQIRNVLEDLPAKDRGLLRAVFLEERDKDAVCRDYGVQRDYLRVLLHRARRRLRDLLTRPDIVSHPAERTTGGAHS